MIKKCWDVWNSWSLIGRIVVGLIVGVILAMVVPDNEVIAMLGTLFVSALKAVAPVLVFFLVISALCNAEKVDGMGKVIILYVISIVCAGILAVVASYIAPSYLVLATSASSAAAAPSGIGEVLGNLVLNAVANPIGALADANYLGILTWAVMLGIAFRMAGLSTKKFFKDAADAVSMVVRWIISCAPFGIMGLTYDAVCTSGIEIFTVYGHLVAVLVIVILIVALITNPAIVFAFTRMNPYPLIFHCLKDSAITAFFTRSSAANIPVNMALCKRLGLNKDIYAVSIPLGATINMAGACVTISIMTMAACATLGISVDPVSAVLLCLLAAVSACGASGVAGGSLLLIPLACSLFGIPADISAQVIAVGFIIGVVQDSCETALNSSSDVVFSATAELWERREKGLSVEIPIPHDESSEAEADEAKAAAQA